MSLPLRDCLGRVLATAGHSQKLKYANTVPLRCISPDRSRTIGTQKHTHTYFSAMVRIPALSAIVYSQLETTRQL